MTTAIGTSGTRGMTMESTLGRRRRPTRGGRRVRHPAPTSPRTVSVPRTTAETRRSATMPQCGMTHPTRRASCRRLRRPPRWTTTPPRDLPTRRHLCEEMLRWPMTMRETDPAMAPPPPTTATTRRRSRSPRRLLRSPRSRSRRAAPKTRRPQKTRMRRPSHPRTPHRSTVVHRARPRPARPTRSGARHHRATTRRPAARARAQRARRGTRTSARSRSARPT
mmetsp:Transcript_22212/g.88143  ORF Transcript_22212/g.88143 Transcript_22212/m.88143 type:complete len:222 (+) Transcript_22212:659-1324(+)